MIKKIVCFITFLSIITPSAFAQNMDFPKNPGTEVDGGHTFHQSWTVLTKARTELVQIVKASTYLKDEQETEFVLKLLKNDSEQGPRITTKQSEECYRNNDPKYPLMMDYDKKTKEIFVCHGYFRNFLRTPDSKFPETVRLVQKMLLHEVSHLLGRRTFDGTSDQFSSKILCEYPATAAGIEECYQNSHVYSSVAISHSDTNIIVETLGDNDQNELLADRINTPVVQRKLKQALRSAVIDVEDNFKSNYLGRVFTDLRFDARQSMYRLNIDELKLVASKYSGDLIMKCNLEISLAVESNLYGTVDRSRMRLPVSGSENCVSGNISGANVRYALNRAINKLHRIVSSERQLKFNIDPRITMGVNVKSEDSSGVEPYNAKLANKLIRSWNKWMPGYESVIWKVSKIIDRRSVPVKGAYSLAVEAIEINNVDNLAQVKMTFNIVDSIGNVDKVDVIENFITENLTGEMKVKFIEQKIMMALEQQLEVLITFAAKKACDYTVDVATGETFSTLKLDKDSGDMFQLYIGSLVDKPTPLRRKVLKHCREKFRRIDGDISFAEFNLTINHDLHDEY